MLLGFNGWSVLLQPFLFLKSEVIIFVETIKEAVKEKNIEFAKGLLADGMSIEFTVRHSKLSEAEVRELASKLTV